MIPIQDGRDGARRGPNQEPQHFGRFEIQIRSLTFEQPHLERRQANGLDTVATDAHARSVNFWLRNEKGCAMNRKCQNGIMSGVQGGMKEKRLVPNSARAWHEEWPRVRLRTIQYWRAARLTDFIPKTTAVRGPVWYGTDPASLVAGLESTQVFLQTGRLGEYVAADDLSAYHAAWTEVSSPVPTERWIRYRFDEGSLEMQSEASPFGPPWICTDSVVARLDQLQQQHVEWRVTSGAARAANARAAKAEKAANRVTFDQAPSTPTPGGVITQTTKLK
jgi:hypothetical protein